MSEAHHHVGHLDSRVINVVLDFDLDTVETEQPRKRISQHRIAEMPDMCRLIGIDVGVLEDDLSLL